MRDTDARPVILALGSNLGDSDSTIQQAIEAISLDAQGEIRVSAMWCSEPKDMNDDSGDFINACMSFGTQLEPMQLLRRLQEIEVALGRPRAHGKNVERSIDLDMIDYDASVMHLPELILPHPRMLERLFVLLPLREVQPNYCDPVSGRDIEALISAAPDMILSRQ